MNIIKYMGAKQAEKNWHHTCKLNPAVAIASIGSWLGYIKHADSCQIGTILLRAAEEMDIDVGTLR